MIRIPYFAVVLTLLLATGVCRADPPQYSFSVVHGPSYAPSLFLYDVSHGTATVPGDIFGTAASNVQSYGFRYSGASHSMQYLGAGTHVQTGNGSVLAGGFYPVQNIVAASFPGGNPSPIQLPITANTSAVNSINALGDIAGDGDDMNGQAFGFVALNGQAAQIFTGPNSARARIFGVTDNQQVLGIHFDSIGRERATRWNIQGVPTMLPVVDLATSEVEGWNGVGNYVGYSNVRATPNPGQYYRAALWSNDGASVQTLGTLAGFNHSTAHDINDYGVVVGDLASDQFLSVAAMWYPRVSGGYDVYNLNSMFATPGVSWYSALGVMNNGTLVLGGREDSGALVVGIASVVPAPATAVLFAASAYFPLCRRRRRLSHGS